MAEKYKKGDLIIEEGQPGHEGYIILSGKVEAFKTVGDNKITIATLAENQIFGEMSMIDDRPRSASVVALEDTELMMINGDVCNELLYNDPENLCLFLKSIFERLRSMDQAFIEFSTGQSCSAGTLKMSGISPAAKAVLNNETLNINKFPFKIGRKTEGFGKDIFSHNDLYLEDDVPYNVSRNHLSINHCNNKFTVLDRGSTLGTKVNDIRIGGPIKNTQYELKIGENIIVLGSTSSKYIFNVNV